MKLFNKSTLAMALGATLVAAPAVSADLVFNADKTFSKVAEKKPSRKKMKGKLKGKGMEGDDDSDDEDEDDGK